MLLTHFSKQKTYALPSPIGLPIGEKKKKKDCAASSILGYEIVIILIVKLGLQVTETYSCQLKQTTKCECVT